MDTTNQSDTTPPVDLTLYRQQYSYYAKRLLGDLGLGDLEQQERNQLLASIEEYVQQVLNATLLENLDDAHIDRVEEMLEDNASQDEIATYIVTNVPEIDVKIADALAKAYAQMLQESNQLAQAVAKKYSENNASSPETSTPDEPAPIDNPETGSLEVPNQAPETASEEPLVPQQ